MRLFPSRTAKRLDHIEGELAKTTAQLHDALTNIAQSVQELRERPQHDLDQLLALGRERDEQAATIEDQSQELETATRKSDDDTRTIQDLKQHTTEISQALAQVITALTNGPQKDALEETAGMLLEHAEALGLSPEQRRAIGARVPRVAVLLSWGRIHSVHHTMDAARAASIWDDDSRWGQVEPLTSETRVPEMPQAIMTLPVYGCWSDRTSVRLITDSEGVPVGAQGDSSQLHVDASLRVKTFAVEEPAAAVASGCPS